MPNICMVMRLMLPGKFERGYPMKCLWLIWQTKLFSTSTELKKNKNINKKEHEKHLQGLLPVKRRKSERELSFEELLKKRFSVKTVVQVRATGGMAKRTFPLSNFKCSGCKKFSPRAACNFLVVNLKCSQNAFACRPLCHGCHGVCVILVLACEKISWQAQENAKKNRKIGKIK